MARRFLAPCSDADEIRNRSEHDADGYDKTYAGNKVGKDHERDPTNERNNRLLLLSIEEVPETDRTK